MIKLLSHLLYITTLLLCSCSTHTPDATIELLKSHAQEGDLIFRRGTGLVGHAVTLADSDGMYSHVGIVAIVNDEYYVVHAVPHEPDFEGDFDRVKCESIDDFIDRYSNANYGLYRLETDSIQRGIAVSHALRLSEKNTPFDHDYDSTDTTKLYCTELIEYAYSFTDITISEGRRSKITIPGMAGEYIMPSDLTQCKALKPIIII